MEPSSRVTGTVLTQYLSDCKYGGGYGEIKGDDGWYYVWSSGSVYRNTSDLAPGVRVSFDVVSYSYADHIDQLDKPIDRKPKVSV